MTRRPRGRGLPVTRRLACYLLGAIALMFLVAACGACSSPAGRSGAGAPGVTSTTVAADSRDVAYYEAEIEKTVVVLAIVNRPLAEANVPLDDPRMAAVYALRARVQALMAARAVLQSDLAVADSAVQQAHVLLARAKATAEGSDADVVKAAKKLLDSAPKPSRDAAAAATTLDAVIDRLAVFIASQSVVQPAP
jgi:hypothetical protein